MSRCTALFRPFVAALLLGACAPTGSDAAAPGGPKAAADTAAGATAGAPASATATFAMGCFWCAEAAFEPVDGVSSVVSGYTGGDETNPTYEQVSSHRTGHYEAIQVVYDPAKVTYEALLDVFWHNVDPLDGRGQFCDRGDQYRAAVFVHDAEQQRLAEASRQTVAKQLGKEIPVPVVSAEKFWEAEEYHQDYAERNPLRYRLYTNGCGRAARLRAVWGDAAGGHG
jgi:peptide-methionine (S)-S-oxide reductase